MQPKLCPIQPGFDCCVSYNKIVNHLKCYLAISELRHLHILYKEAVREIVHQVTETPAGIL